ncbi:hypothetical protein A5482_012470 [Cyanobacterium sp. IPPAS B-1200]|uniref:hypothetical protein n=1 Tax=Cyanobacterium sp. IPPAS B-1200 TaxID=1562720 RepID=UPI001F5687A7|nr:hypothetical protein [Cyanobacterium sp. IPPAS B-1200]
MATKDLVNPHPGQGIPVKAKIIQENGDCCSVTLRKYEAMIRELNIKIKSDRP